MGLFRDSLKKWFYTNNSSAASSDARVPLLNADGTPKGSDTMVNLASVLGAFIYSTNIKEATTVTDLNAETGDYKSFSRKFVSTQSSPANLPDGVSSNRFFLEVYNTSNYYLVQKIYIIKNNSYAIYSRSKFGINDWTNWKTIA
jgi:hypothetical protein